MDSSFFLIKDDEIDRYINLWTVNHVEKHYTSNKNFDYLRIHFLSGETLIWRVTTPESKESIDTFLRYIEAKIEEM